MGSMPFLKQLLKKMSAKEVEMMQRMPKSLMAQGRGSRGPTAKVVTRHEDGGVAVRGLVEYEIVAFAAVLVVAHLIEGGHAEARCA